MTASRLLVPLGFLLVLCTLFTARGRAAVAPPALAPAPDPASFEFVESHGAVLLRVEARVDDPTRVMLIADHGEEMDILAVLPAGRDGVLGFAGSTALMRAATTWHLLDGTRRIELPRPRRRALV